MFDRYQQAGLWLCGFILLAGCQQAQPAKPSTPPPVEVTVMKAMPQTIPATFEYVGFVKSSHEVEIRARISGYLDVVNEREGMHVKKDTILFKIDARPFEAALDNAKGEVARQQAQLWEAERAVARLKPLYEQKAASRRDLDNAIAQRLSLQALVQSAEARVRQAQLDLDYTVIRAPVDGEVGASNYRVGALVTANETLLTTLSVVDPIWINFSVPERDMLKARDEKDQGLLKFPPHDDFDIEVTLIDGTVLPERGKVNFLSPTYDIKTGTLMVRAQVPNAKGWLNPGQFVRVRVLGAVRPSAIVIPQRAVVQSKNGMFAYIVDANNKVEQRKIQVGNWYGNDWIVLAGLQPEEKVIVDGVNKVSPGSLVQVSNALHDTAAPSPSKDAAAS